MSEYVPGTIPLRCFGVIQPSPFTLASGIPPEASFFVTSHQYPIHCNAFRSLDFRLDFFNLPRIRRQRSETFIYGTVTPAPPVTVSHMNRDILKNVITRSVYEVEERTGGMASVGSRPNALRIYWFAMLWILGCQCMCWPTKRHAGDISW